LSPYEEVILDHWKNPRNKGRLVNPDLVGVEVNPLCGDAVRLELKVDEGRVTELRFDGQGCAISQAAASILTELIRGRTVTELKGIKDEELLSALGGVIETRRVVRFCPCKPYEKQ
jgi:NifU homolog involved in Fe-S cluster formation